MPLVLIEEERKKYREKGVTHILHVIDNLEGKRYEVHVNENQIYEDVCEQYSRRYGQ